MAIHGFVVLAPGVLLLAFASTALWVYAALFLMAVGSAQVIPCLSSLASGYAPAHEQGRILGVFRSLGALARGVGPLIACVLYWRLGSLAAYALLAAAFIWPLGLVATLPPQPESEPARAT
jgi:MFS family permease